jgi:hypothetical protein
VFQNPGDNPFLRIIQGRGQHPSPGIAQFNEVTGPAGRPVAGVTVGYHPGMTKLQHLGGLRSDLKRIRFHDPILVDDQVFDWERPGNMRRRTGRAPIVTALPPPAKTKGTGGKSSE